VLGQNVYVAPTVVIGDGVRVQNNVSLYDGVTIEAHAFLGPSATPDVALFEQLYPDGVPEGEAAG